MIEDHANTRAQPAPTGDGVSITDAVVTDLLTRREHGRAKYGTELRSHNGRDAEVDLYQELLDAVVYQKQRLVERGGMRLVHPNVFERLVNLSVLIELLIGHTEIEHVRTWIIGAADAVTALPKAQTAARLAGRWQEVALKLAPVTAGAIAFDPMQPETWIAAIMASQDRRTLDELAADAVTAIGAVYSHMEDRTAATKQLRDLADYAESCIESLNRR